MSIESVMSSNHLILCHTLLLLPSIFPSIRVFSNVSSDGQSIGASASASVLPMNVQDWFPLDWLVWSPCSPRDFQESSPTPQSSKASILQCSAFFIVQLSHPYVITGKTIALTIQTLVIKLFVVLTGQSILLLAQYTKATLEGPCSQLLQPLVSFP